MGIGKKLKTKAMKKVSKRLEQAQPYLINIATENDIAFFQLMETIIEINKKRKENNQDHYDISLKSCSIQ